MVKKIDIEADVLDSCVRCVLSELKSAQKKFPPFNSNHEGFAVIKEEVDELWEEIKKRKTSVGGYQPNVEKECIQVAAMAIRFLYDLT